MVTHICSILDTANNGCAKAAYVLTQGAQISLGVFLLPFHLIPHEMDMIDHACI